MRPAARELPVELGRESVPPHRRKRLPRLLQFYIRLGKIKHTTVAVIERGGEVSGKLPLQDQAQTAGIQVSSLVGERAGVNVGQHLATPRRRNPDAGQDGVRDLVRIESKLQVVPAETP